MKKILRKLFLTSFIIFLVLPLFNLNAKASTQLQSGFYTISSMLAPNKVIDIEWASKDIGANIQLYDKNNSPAQIFYITPTDDGYYNIRAICSGYALDVARANIFHGANVWQWGMNGTDAQKWQIESLDDDVVRIKSKLGDYYLDVESARTDNGTNVRMWGWNGTAAQKFKLKKVDMEKYGINGKKTYSERRFLKLKNYFLKHYAGKRGKYALVIGKEKFLNSFSEAFKNDIGFKFDVVSSINDVKNTEKYDFIINEKYHFGFLKLIFANAEIENFRGLYNKIICQAAIDHLKQNNIPVYFFKAISHGEISDFSDLDRELSSCHVGQARLKDNPILDKIFGHVEECKNYFNSGEFSKSSNVIKVKNHYALADFKGQYCNIIDHHRYVKNAPEKYRNTVYLYGPCTMRSKYVSDNYTIENFMQKRINKDFPNSYNVIGYGCEGEESNDFEYILDTQFKPGDIVVVERDFSDKIKKIINKNGCYFKPLANYFNLIHATNFVVNDITHFNHRGCKFTADFIYECIKSKINEFLHIRFKDRVIEFDENDQEYQSFIKENPEFLDFIKNLEKIAKPYKDAHKKIGSLNVNCNPFTKGHRYLIEEALKKVDHLFLFVVEEDASEFSFKDRYEMVKRGIADLDNITLLKTGKWMCSKFTFPEYFDKDNLQKKTIVYPTKDVGLYGKYIAPAIGATLRFFGEEPLDLVTRQHNNFMREKLPNYGVKVIEIPRKTLSDGQVISASKVRKYLKEKNFDELKKLVPRTTYDYLVDNFT